MKIGNFDECRCCCRCWCGCIERCKAIGCFVYIFALNICSVYFKRTLKAIPINCTTAICEWCWQHRHSPSLVVRGLYQFISVWYAFTNAMQSNENATSIRIQIRIWIEAKLHANSHTHSVGSHSGLLVSIWNVYGFSSFISRKQKRNTRLNHRRTCIRSGTFYRVQNAYINKQSMNKMIFKFGWDFLFRCSIWCNIWIMNDNEMGCLKIWINCF